MKGRRTRFHITLRYFPDSKPILRLHIGGHICLLSVFLADTFNQVRYRLDPEEHEHVADCSVSLEMKDKFSLKRLCMTAQNYNPIAPG